jgi:thiamine monophosphate kinase
VPQTLLARADEVIKCLSSSRRLYRPRFGILLNTYLSENCELANWQSLVMAAQESAGHFGAYVLGGDTKQAREDVIVGTGIGTVEKSCLLRRKTARAGDVLALSSKMKKKVGLAWSYFVADHYRVDLPEETLDELRSCYLADNLSLPFHETRAAALSGAVTACVDTSDGIGGALHLITNDGKLGALISYPDVMSLLDGRAIAIANKLNVDPLKFLFTPGFVWENLFAIQAERFEEVRQLVRREDGDLVRIGMVSKEAGIAMRYADGSLRKVALFFNENFTGGDWLERELWAKVGDGMKG